MCTFPLAPLPANNCKIERIDIGFNFNPVFSPLARGIGRSRHLDHNSLMPCFKSFFICPFDFPWITADNLGGEILVHNTLEAFPALFQREIDERLTIKIED